MADLFLSYAREDLARARVLAASLESQGWTVFWDRRIPHGQDFSAYLQARLDEALCVIVAWSKASIGSQFVRDEADEGRNRLVPLRLDDVRPPLGFRQLQTANLADWNGGSAAPHEEFDLFVDSIRAVVLTRRPQGSVDGSGPVPPTPLRTFPADVYISYAAFDNVPLSDGNKGWVANFVRALEVRTAQLLGRQLTVLWEPMLENKIPDDIELARLHDVAAFVAIVSSHYTQSKWAARELAEFCNVAPTSGGLEIQGKPRLFKILRRPVNRASLPQALVSPLAYEFFTMDPTSGKVREFDRIFGPDAERDFWLRLDDLAHDLSELLAGMANHGPTSL